MTTFNWSMPIQQSKSEGSDSGSGRSDSIGTVSALRGVQIVLLLVAVAFLALHFVHLTADFPNHTEWRDWSKFTDEGWYGAAAIRHYQLGHWNVPGDFNPAAALPVWPVLEIVLFRFTGVSIGAARALAVTVFALILLATHLLLRRWRPSSESIAPEVSVFLLAISPFCFAFMRLAILEPLLVLLMLAALILASATGRALLHVEPPGVGRNRRRVLYVLLLGVLLPVMALTKTTAVFLFPSVFWMLLGSAGYKLRSFLRAALPAAAIGAALWATYFVLFVRPHFLEDYRYLYAANAYTGATLRAFPSIVGDTIYDGIWIGRILYAVALICVVGALPSLFSPRLRDPLPASLMIWIFGYASFMAYHNNLQPRYYLVLAVPLTMLVGIVYDRMLHAAIIGASRSGVAESAGDPAARGDTLLLRFSAALVSLCICAAAINGGRHTLHFVFHPAYTYRDAARSIGREIRSESPANLNTSRLLLSRSGADLSLMNGIPAICDEFGTDDLQQRIATYHPGWFATWNEVEDDEMDTFSPAYRLERVSAYPIMDDPDRNLLILYRITPTGSPTAPPKNRRPGGRILRKFRPRLGEDPEKE